MSHPHDSFTLHYSIIFDRLAKTGRMYEELTTRHLNEYGEAGLRTLALSYRKLGEDEYAAWNADFTKAKTTIGPERELMLEQASDAMEKDLILVGATAVEDKLQRGVHIIIAYQLILNLFPLFKIFLLIVLLYA